MDLYLVRHAPAVQKDPDRWRHDGKRPLTPEGEKEFRLAARGLARMAPRADVILSSPARRAWQTAELLSELDSWPAPKPLPVVAASRRRASPEKATLALVGLRGREIRRRGRAQTPPARARRVPAHRGTRWPGDQDQKRRRNVHPLRRRPCAGHRQAALAAHAKSPALPSWSAPQLVSISAFPARWLIG